MMVNQINGNGAVARRGSRDQMLLVSLPQTRIAGH